jgi:RNA polymerase sigma-70 factor (ECF subfamily)
MEPLHANANVLEPTSLSLLVRARASDEEAWRQIVHLYGPLVHRWCKRSGLDDNDLADVFQESFRAVAKNLQGFAPNKSVGAFRSWLSTIVRTKIADHFRRRAQHPGGQGGTAAQLHLAEMADPLHDGRFDESDADIASDRALVVRQAMELIKPQFTPQNWQAFWQVAVEGRSAVDVAEQLGVNAQAVRQANYRIRRRLREILEGLLDDL